ncbi:hypothetical protein DPMN_153348 [Dreissena polymorpha]|uniref:Uncharacterized protein n=1 Tax=Dreissena polymorpha TaxID=45954 RepID=A0A9D4FIH7_DREPO|nr:hypothetical protein DPMN_153348 [Dreissena polymorpha]
MIIGLWLGWPPSILERTVSDDQLSCQSSQSSWQQPQSPGQWSVSDHSRMSIQSPMHADSDLGSQSPMGVPNGKTYGVCHQYIWGGGVVNGKTYGTYGVCHQYIWDKWDIWGDIWGGVCHQYIWDIWGGGVVNGKTNGTYGVVRVDNGKVSPILADIFYMGYPRY